MEHSNAPLAEKLAITLSDTVVYSLLAQGYHWNVLGADFNEYHEFFGKIYEDTSGSVDAIAEYILKLGYEAPYLISDFHELSNILEDRITGGSSAEMAESLLRANTILIQDVLEVFEAATACNQQAIADYAAGRLDAFQKWQWQLKATLGIR